MEKDNRDYTNYEEEKHRKYRGIFYVTVSVITLIVAIIGASFSYFIASASSNEGAIQAGSTGFSLDYTDSYENLFNYDLIPASSNVALYGAIAQTYDATTYDAYNNNPTAENKKALANNRCRDDNGNAVCSTYKFTVTNPADMGVAQTLNFKIVPTVNSFSNLYIMIVDPELVDSTASSREEAGVVLDEYHLSSKNLSGNAYELSELSEAMHPTLQPGESKTYEIIIYILNLEDDETTGISGDQTEQDSNKNFAASIVVYPDGQSANQIYGVIGASSGAFGD